MQYLITGATGNLGSQIVKQFSKVAPINQTRLAVHTLTKAKTELSAGYEVVPIDFLKPESLTAAFRGVDVLIYVASKSHDSFSRVTELENVISAAQKASVGHILSMGFMADQANNPFDLSGFYGYLPRRLASSGLSYTILRNALYADPLIPYLPELIKRQNVIYPIGNQSLSFISLEDSAGAFAKVATTPNLLKDGRIYTLTESRNYTMPELAKVLTEVSGNSIGYQPVSLQAFADLYNEDGGGHNLASMYKSGAMGLLKDISPDYQFITGHEATDLTTFLTNNYSK